MSSIIKLVIFPSYYGNIIKPRKYTARPILPAQVL